MEVHQYVVLPCLRIQADRFPGCSVGQFEDDYRIGRARESGEKESQLSICDVPACCLLQIRCPIHYDIPAGVASGIRWTYSRLFDSGSS